MPKELDDLPEGTYQPATAEELPDEFNVINKTTNPLRIPSKAKDSSNKPKSALAIPPWESAQVTKEFLYSLEYEESLKRQDIVLEPIWPDYTLVNKTARRIGVDAAQPGDPLIIPAFGSRRLSLPVLKQYSYQPWVQRNLIDVRRVHPTETHPNWFFDAYLYLVGAYLFAAFIVGSYEDKAWLGGVGKFWLYFGIGIAILAILGLALLLFNSLKEGQFGRFTNLLLLIASALVPVSLVMYFFGGSVLWEQGMLTIGLLGRAFQFVLILLLSLLPGSLYFLFERQRVASIRDGLFREIMMLNPNVVTLDDANIMYGTMVDEISGTVGETSRQYSLLGRGIPVMVATWLIALGWLFTLNPIGMLGETEGDQLASFLYPGRSSLSFAFLGAYFFALNLIFRRYTRGDLAPKAYSHITVRILTSIIVVWVIGTIPWLTSNLPILMIVAFLVGIVPESGVALIRDVAQKTPILKKFPPLQEEDPVTALEGVNLYDRARLLEEGIESVENLVHYNLIELMLRTRMPTPRLVDLVDQAILYLHVRGDINGETDSAPLDRLREFGIRTASDLIRVCKAENDTGRRRLLALLGPADKALPRRLEVILNAIQNDGLIDSVLHWRATSRASTRPYALSEFYAAEPETERPDSVSAGAQEQTPDPAETPSDPV
jgi:hypothetical protein